MTEQTAKPRSKRMVGFYVGTGVAVALFVAGWLVRTPLRVRYYEWQAKRSYAGSDSPTFKFTDSSRRDLQRGWVAIAKLVEMGPVAAPALKRLLSSEEQPLRYEVTAWMHMRGDDWVLPLLVLAAQDHDEQIADTARHLVEVRLQKDFVRFTTTDDLLNWWNREGKAKYGRGGE